MSLLEVTDLKVTFPTDALDVTVQGQILDVLKTARSEERRGGKGCRSRWSAYH